MRYQISKSAFLAIIASLAVTSLPGDLSAATLRYHCRGDNPGLPEFVTFLFDDHTLEFELLEYAPAGLSNSDKIAGPTVEGGMLDFTVEYYVEGYVEMRESHTVHFDTLDYFSGMMLYDEAGNVAGRGPLGEGKCSVRSP